VSAVVLAKEEGERAGVRVLQVFPASAICKSVVGASIANAFFPSSDI
jgi:hypothetical protein